MLKSYLLHCSFYNIDYSSFILCLSCILIVLVQDEKKQSRYYTCEAEKRKLKNIYQIISGSKAVESDENQ